MSSDNNDPSETRPPEGPTEIIDTDYQAGQDNFIRRKGWLKVDIHNPVFLISGLTIVGFVVLTLIIGPVATDAFVALRDFLTSRFDWFFLLAGNIFVLVCLGLIVSPLGKIRIGGRDATPDYSYTGWLAMLFAAGMGIGLVFYGVSEPVSHFTASMGGVRTDWAPLGGAVGDADTARRLAMAATIFHWGLHPWAIYAIVGLALAIFAYNKGLPLTMRSIFYPLLGERV